MTVLQAVLIVLFCRPPAPRDWYADLLNDRNKLRFAGRHR